MRVIYPTPEEIAIYEREMADSDDEEEPKGPSDPLSLGGSDGSSAKPITLDDDDDSNADSDIQVIADTTPTKAIKPPSTPVKRSPDKDKKDGEYPPYATYKYEVEEELALDFKTCKVK